MTGYLLDTSVLSATAPERPDVPPAFTAWLFENEKRLHVSVVTIAEIEQGIAGLALADRTKRARILADWLERTVELFGTRVLPLTTPLARIVGQIGAEALAIGRHPGFPDVAIAASARWHGLTVATRNTRHFEPLRVDIVDPLAVRS